MTILTKSEPTPGPYRYTCDGWIVTESPECQLDEIARLEQPGTFTEEEIHANGYLLAASWGMLEALERLIYDASGDQSNPLIRSKTLDTIALARTVVTHARGQEAVAPATESR